MATSNIVQGASCCSCSSDCCGPEPNVRTAKRHVNIDFLYLDLSVCSRCQGTDENLDAALDEVAAVLKAAGVEVSVNKIQVSNEEQARELRFASSPTIRVNGRDIQIEVKESVCDSCGELCGDTVDCRVWVYQGQEYTVPPKAMIVDAILREVYGGESGNFTSSSEEFVVPGNLKRFFHAMRQKDSKGGEQSER